jgi:Uma2 family endonuclease
MSIQSVDITPSRRRFSVEEYHRLTETGFLAEDDHVELIDGEIIEMAPIGSRHAGHVKHLLQLIGTDIGKNAVWSVQDPVQLGDYSEPQPDFALLKPREDYYSSSHATAEDILLIVEIADTSLDYDRSIKIPLYASHGVPVVWLLNLRERTIEIYERPDADGYQVSHSLRGDALVEHEALGLRYEARALFI